MSRRIGHLDADCFYVSCERVTSLEIDEREDCNLLARYAEMRKISVDAAGDEFDIAY